ncbi:MAG: TAT-variant-translocated molybdopterin oxidoreductase, partial [Deltaproteobacteria bacterium]|nr:TAT-variant-translocated molybdopterin oxidoreductase [Deltaproteobacteria bacterium]
MNKESPKYWGSLEEYEQTEAFLASQGKEFVTPPEQVSITEMERRDFLKIMGAGMLFATAACYRRPVEKIIPYVNRPLEVTPGIPDWYTSTCTECSVGCGLLVKTREGRPVKLEGNESHPLNQGGLCARGQASILNLYDPDRLRHAVQVNRGEGTSKEISWKDLDEKIKNELAAIKQKNGKIYLLTGSNSSPSQASLIQEFLNAFPGAAHVSYDVTLPEEISKGQELSYGQKITPRYRIDQAKAVVTFGADFLGTWLSPVEYARGFAKARKVEEGKMNQLLVVESVLSLTGSNADQYLSVKSGDELSVALAIAHEILVAQKQSRYASDGQVTQALSAYAPEAVAAKVGVDAKQIKKVAQALIENKGQSLVLGGSVHAKNGLALQ